MRRDSRALSAFLLVAALCGSAPARANGAFPFVSQLVSNPSPPEELVLRGNFGLVGQAGTAIVPPAPTPHASGGCSLGALVSSPQGLGGTTLALLLLGVRARRRRAKLEG